MMVNQLVTLDESRRDFKPNYEFGEEDELEIMARHKTFEIAISQEKEKALQKVSELPL